MLIPSNSGELDGIMGFNGDDFREEITAGESNVLQDEVNGIICILDARDRDIADLTLAAATPHFANTPYQQA